MRKTMETVEKSVECYILGQRNEQGRIEYLIDTIALDRRVLESSLYQMGYICEYADGQCWKYRLKTSNQIDFYIRKIILPLGRNQR
ncbi:TPA: hypothetical protein ACNHTV_001516 [Enterococcus faecalis]|uniref:hypothetical protein n=2 Tax=Enterococcus faecalis TaxID=1351 RepID=UPI001EE4C897|nr:hypothetical protein [Enterococcus faecalis]EHB5081931.1 hypothetical protein [Enterococcus faecalis]EKK5287633.1 hypothetical protein [Enterococcus faecalis]MDK7897370.1 hypothetical protein [Enterococcus faecalis]UKU96291.1 hypothetical protein L5I25_09650 [Enterococcus faecalis]UKU98986.1 hypothetical protein L5I23_09730 [Enterococcus faecalis]